MTAPVRRRYSIPFNCPSCRQAYVVFAQWAGQALPCQRCGTAMTVPAADDRPRSGPPARSSTPALTTPLAALSWLPGEMEVNAAFLHSGALVRPQPRGPRVVVPRTRSVARPS